MATQIIKGNKIQLFYQGETFAYATAHTLNITGNTLDISSKDHGVFGASEIGSITWEVTGDYFYTDYDYDTLFDLMLYRRPIMVEVAEVRNYSENGLISTGGDVAAWWPCVITRRGYAVITSLNTNANTGENATYSITLTGSGPLVIVDNSITQYVMYVKYKQSELADGMQLFDQRAYPFVNSCWVYQEGHENDKERIDISDCTLHDATPDRDAIFMYYLSGGSVPKYMFYNNNNILQVLLNAKIGEIEQFAFANSSVTSLDTENTIKYGHSCFSGCMSLASINEDQDHVNNLEARRINNDAFRDCVRLGDISTGENCEYILHHAFAGCLMRTVYFGSSVRRIGEAAFNFTGGTMTFHFYSEQAPEMDIDGVPPLNPIGYQSFIIHGDSIEYFLTHYPDMAPLAMAVIYPQNQCDYQLSSRT